MRRAAVDDPAATVAEIAVEAATAVAEIVAEAAATAVAAETGAAATAGRGSKNRTLAKCETLQGFLIPIRCSKIALVIHWLTAEC